jgi:hypothetical protein
MEYKEAFEATNPDPSAYGIPPDDPNRDERLAKARETAALNLLAGTVANETYFNSRTELEALAAKAQGHGGIGVPPDQVTDATVVEGSEPAGELPANTETGTEVVPTGSGEVAPTPENPVEAVAKLRAQLEANNLKPEA